MLDEEDPAWLKANPGAGVLDLLAYLLHKNGLLLVKKGLAKQYVRQAEIIKGIKGKLNVGASVRADLLRQGKAACVYETLTPDILPNQVIKAVVRQLILTPGLHPDIQAALLVLAGAFREVKLIEIGSEVVIPGRLPNYFNQYYARVLPVCALILKNLLPEPGGKQYFFADFLRDERQMGKLFEAFVRNFYRREQTQFSVKSEKINWQLDNADEQALQYLPQMKTDISLTSGNRKIIIDTKYYLNALVRHYDKPMLISGHLYQLFAYLKNQPRVKEVKTAGILLYPVVNQELDLLYELSGHQISIKTINLNQPWQNIKADLLKVIA